MSNAADGLSRRAFVRRGVAVGGALGGLHVAHALLGGAVPADAAVLSSVQDLRALFGLRYPIVQAALAGAGGPELAIAVAEAGALGSLALTRESPETAERLVRQVKAATRGAFFLNYVLRAEPPSLARALEAGPPAVQFSWGMPTAEHVRLVRAAGAKLGVQVTGAGSARAALSLGADYLVCQGIEAGGHVQASRPLDETLEEVLGEVRRVRPGVPVVAAGGIATGRDVRRVLSRGAAGAALGTRLVATQESRAHPEYKRALVEAGGARDTVLTTCLNKGWPNAPHRILRGNGTFQMWEAAGSPPAGGRPGENDVVARTMSGAPVERYTVAVPEEGMAGEILSLGTFAGAGVGDVRDTPPAGELVRRIWREYEQARG
jgi:nitronate monooxygenase